jgi:hypothetical protein
VGIVLEIGHRGVTSRGLGAGMAGRHVNLFSKAALLAGRQMLTLVLFRGTGQTTYEQVYVFVFFSEITLPILNTFGAENLY